jgi:hypothetical protein
LQALNGIFEVRIYPAEYSVRYLNAKLKHEATFLSPSDTRPPPVGDDATADRLNRILSPLDQGEVRKRRRLYNRLYHEARLLIQYKRGLEFTETLELLAHYKLIVDREALV